MLKLTDTEEKLQKIENYQRNWEVLRSRVDTLENLTSKFKSKNSELEVVRSEQPSNVGNRQEQLVNTFLV